MGSFCMPLPERVTDLIIDREAYRVCRLLSLRDFVSFCRDRNMPVQAERLRHLERLGLFFPMLRIYRIDVIHKVEFLDVGSRYHDFGELREGESWDGDVQTELAGLDFSRRVIQSWIEHGNAWDPRTQISPHATTIDPDPRPHEAYYSQFQAFEVDYLLRPLTATVHIEWALRDDGTIDPAWGDQLKPNLSEFAANIARQRTQNPDRELSTLCQIVSDRYYPKTQGDERHIMIPMSGLEFGTTVIQRVPDVIVEDDPLRALELVANDFGVNPKPQVVLFVEGATELAAVPRLFDKMFATTPNIIGIELVSLGGVSNATGGKDSTYSALWRLIDYLHHHQTIAFVLLDNEGLAPVNIGKGLRRAQSIHFPDRRATRPNYVKLWKLSLEMGNL